MTTYYFIEIPLEGTVYNASTNDHLYYTQGNQFIKFTTKSSLQIYAQKIIAN